MIAPCKRQVKAIRHLIVRTAEAARCGSGGEGAGELCKWLWWGTVDDKVREDDERDAMESSPQHGRKLRGGKVTGRGETIHMMQAYSQVCS